jgi:hypothetical protein
MPPMQLTAPNQQPKVWQPKSTGGVPGRTRRWGTAAAALSSLQGGTGQGGAGAGQGSSGRRPGEPTQPSAAASRLCCVVYKVPGSVPNSAGRQHCWQPPAAALPQPRTDIKGADARLGTLQQVCAALQSHLAALQARQVGCRQDTQINARLLPRRCAEMAAGWGPLLQVQPRPYPDSLYEAQPSRPPSPSRPPLRAR